MMSGTTQQAGAIMRYSEQHYPLLTKFRVGPDPLEAEAKNTKIEPTSSTRQAVMGMVLRQVTGDDEGQLSRELVRKWEQKRQLEALPKQVDTWFAAEFMRWLRGVSVFNHGGLTPWGNANLFHIPEVLAYLREACACRADFQRKLVHLAIFEPRTLNDAYLYYKYIVMHHGWSKEQGGPHRANNPPTPPYLTIGGALDFLDDYSLTTFQDQALAMQALNAPEPRLYGPNQDLPRPEPNAAPTAQPAPGVPPAPGDPDAHAGGHDDEDEDDDDDQPPGGSVPSTAGVLATSAAIARERAEREAVAAAIAHRMALNNAAATRAQQRQAEDALEELNAADVDGGQPPGGSVPSTAGVLATSAAIARGRAEREAAQMSTDRPAQIQAAIDAIVADIPNPPEVITVDSPGGQSSIEGEAGRVAFASPDDPNAVRHFATRYHGQTPPSDSPEGEPDTNTGANNLPTPPQTPSWARPAVEYNNALPISSAGARASDPATPLGAVQRAGSSSLSAAPASPGARAIAILDSPGQHSPAAVVAARNLAEATARLDATLGSVDALSKVPSVSSKTLDLALESAGQRAVGVQAAERELETAVQSEPPPAMTPAQQAQALEDHLLAAIDADDRANGVYVPPADVPDDPVSEILNNLDAYTEDEQWAANRVRALALLAKQKEIAAKKGGSITRPITIALIEGYRRETDAILERLREGWKHHRRITNDRRVRRRVNAK